MRSPRAFSFLLPFFAVCALTSGPASATPHTFVRDSLHLVVALPLHHQAELEGLIANQVDQRSPLYHHFLTPAQFRARYGATHTEIQAAAAVLLAQGLTVTSTAAQSLDVRGSATNIERLFGTHLRALRTAHGGARLAAATPLRMPSALQALQANVIGLAPVVTKHSFSRSVPVASNRYGVNSNYWFTDLKQAYSYPSFETGLTGKGVTIGIVIDSAVDPHDLVVYGQAEKFTTYSRGAANPTITIRPVIGGAPTTSATDPYNPNGDGAEAALDMEQSIGSAPGASAVIYDMPTYYDDAVIAAYVDVVEDNAVDIVSSSFGECELAYSAANNHGQDYSGILQTFHSIFLQGNAEGITWVASSGDRGNLNCPAPNYFNDYTAAKFIPSIDTPASDPNVVAVGGTNLITTSLPPPSLHSQYVREHAYGDPQIPTDVYGFGALVYGGIFASGSGPSAYFAKPAYQLLVETHQRMRMTPDVSMQMGGCPSDTSVLGGPDTYCGYAGPVFDHQPRSGAVVYYSGPGTSSDGLIGLVGTSASSPEFAGLLAIKAQTLHSRLGNANELIYSIAAANNAFPGHFFHQGIPGYNGVVRTTNATGYSPIVGVGTPYAANFLGVPTDPLTGDPQTVSNP